MLKYEGGKGMMKTTRGGHGMTSTRAQAASWAVMVVLAFAGGSVAEAQATEDPTAAPVDTTVDATATNNEARRREAAAHFLMGVSLYE